MTTHRRRGCPLTFTGTEVQSVSAVVPVRVIAGARNGWATGAVRTRWVVARILLPAVTDWAEVGIVPVAIQTITEAVRAHVRGHLTTLGRGRPDCPVPPVGGGHHLPSNSTSKAGHLGVSQTESMLIQIG